ncbi:hypothetical protein E2562_006512 [Oryza meyeriana var. granulata]|uniref:DUF834 domain-containing protein n=1 Tax=Oryza meyeriana var. granulata TaxID=110450 RepID=A0A6G1CQ11_9ORYZ|nr:hypothetical protein E2562_006512 [Oryza meyeriana var. granulata]
MDQSPDVTGYAIGRGPSGVDEGGAGGGGRPLTVLMSIGREGARDQGGSDREGDGGGHPFAMLITIGREGAGGDGRSCALAVLVPVAVP